MASEASRPESPQVRTRSIIAVVAGILVLLILIAFGLELAFPDRVGKTFTVRHPFPAPAVIPDERAQRWALESRQRRLLNGGGGRVPIETAMKLIVARGPHAFDPLAAKP